MSEYLHVQPHGKSESFFVRCPDVDAETEDGKSRYEIVDDGGRGLNEWLHADEVRKHRQISRAIKTERNGLVPV